MTNDQILTLSPEEIRELHQTHLNSARTEIEHAFAHLTDLCNSWFSNIQGFNRDNFDGDCMLVVTELAEAVEADRKPGTMDQHCPTFPGRDIEIADTFVRLFHLCGKYRIDITPAFFAKMEYNLTRPFRHGKGY